ncbi:MAG: AraC family transcriptional regulator [Clostridia bacterium]|nr:AraC family transcriptional regulator [Clostridia bacterium]
MIGEITYFSHNKFATQKQIERHEIKFNELTFLISGEMTYYVNDVKHILNSGDIIYLPPGSIRQREIGDVLNDYLSINFHSDSPLDFDTIVKNCINNEVKLLLNYFESAFSSPSTDSQAKLRLVLETLIMQITDNLYDSYTSPLSAEIISFISSHYTEKITLNDISQATFYSAAYCENEFKKTTGKSIINYLIDVRVNAAKKLLAESSMSCSRIAAAVGFEDANYFSRIFKKRTGYSPLKYRDFSGL